jgi:CRP-like cAMP-binding protein
MEFGKADDKELEQALVNELTRIVLEAMQANPEKDYTKADLGGILEKADRGCSRATLTKVVADLKDSDEIRTGKKGHADLFRWQPEQAPLEGWTDGAQ